MKTIKILAIMIVIVGIIYYQLDKKLFYYGRNDLHIYHLLPLKIEPDYSPPFEGGFALRDAYGLSIAGKGVAYSINNKPIWINKVLKYGFNKQHLVAIVIDSSKVKYYLNFYQESKNRTTINAAIEAYNRFSDLKSYKWVDIENNDDYSWNLALYRNYSMFIIIFSIFILVYKLVKYRKANKKIQNQF